MNDVAQWLGTSPLASFLKVFVSVLLTVAVAEWAEVGDIGFDNWQTWVIAGLVSAIPVLANWLNPNDPRYGKTE